jgi:GT2 family glycosyltransferase
MAASAALPLVSVLMPAFNHASYVGAAVESVLGQRYANLELIVIDDASTDATWTVLQTYADARLHVSRHESNRGAHATLNEALYLAQGKYVAILNSDDVYHPDRLQVLVDAAEAAGVEDYFAFTGLAFIDEIDRFVPEDERARAYWRLFRDCRDRPERLWFVVGNPAVSTSNFFFSRSLLDRVGAFSPLRYTHDWDWALRAASVQAPVWVRRQLLRYRVHPGSTLGEGDVWRHVHENSYLQTRALLAQAGDDMPDVVAALLRNESLHPLSLMCFLALVVGGADADGLLHLAQGTNGAWMLPRIAEAGQCPADWFGSLPQLLEKDRVIAAQAALIDERWRAMRHMDREIEDRDRMIADRDAFIADQEGQIADRDAFIQEQQACIAAQTEMVEARWRAMQEMGEDIALREARIGELERLLARPLLRFAAGVQRRLGAWRNPPDA